MRAGFNLFDFQRRGLGMLLGWAAGSLVAGAGLRQSQRALLRGAGGQLGLWGAVNMLLAGVGLRKSGSWRREYERGEMSAITYTSHLRQTQSILWGSVVVDGLMVGCGLWLLRRARDDEAGRGAGWGVLAQGSFLLAFDLTHALLLRRGRAERTLPQARWWKLQAARRKTHG